MTTGVSYDRCPATTRGDLQLEVVLTPLLLLHKPLPSVVAHTPHDTQPDLSLLDIGCGAGRLAGAVSGFAAHIVDHLRYVGCEADAASAEAARLELGRLLRDPAFAPVRTVLRGARVTTWTAATTDAKESSAYDVAFVVNVLHHVDLPALPAFLAGVVSLVRDGGYVVLHDFYLAGDPSTCDTSKYCDGCLFLSPMHYSAMFAMASTQTGRYRVVERTSRTGRYDLFTLVLHVENELSARAADESVRGDEPFSHLDVAPAVDVALLHHQDEVSGWNDSALANAYRETLRDRRARFDREWPYDMRATPASYAAAKWLGLGPDRLVRR